VKVGVLMPDLDRCQAQSRATHGPFMLGPRPEWVRCAKAARWLAIEGKPSADGLRGVMALCGGCRKIMFEVNAAGGPLGMHLNKVKLRTVDQYRAARRLGGVEAVVAMLRADHVVIDENLSRSVSRR
jgi:hypothetical protein